MSVILKTFFFFFEIGPHYVAQTDLELVVIFPPLSAGFAGMPGTAGQFGLSVPKAPR
jgi:hypothetical protein